MIYASGKIPECCLLYHQFWICTEPFTAFTHHHKNISKHHTKVFSLKKTSYHFWTLRIPFEWLAWPKDIHWLQPLRSHYYSSINLSCPNNYNPAEFYIKAVSESGGDRVKALENNSVETDEQDESGPAARTHRHSRMYTVHIDTLRFTSNLRPYTDTLYF